MTSPLRTQEKLTLSLLNQLKWYFFGHPAYLPDLAPSDYHLILVDLDGRYFAMEEDLQSEVAEFFAKQSARRYSTGIHKLILRYNKCPYEQGDYVEKYKKFCEESNKRSFQALSFFSPVLRTV